MRILCSLLLLTLVYSSYGQCDFDFDCEPKNAAKGINDGEIKVKLNSDSNYFDFKLVNLATGEVVQELNDKQISANQKVVLFKGLRQAAYVIYVKAKDCDKQKSLGGQFGIIIQEE